MERLELCDSLELLSNTTCPWLVGRNFNVICNSEEKLRGGMEFDPVEVVEFNQCISTYVLTKVQRTSSQFTWWNGRIEEQSIFKRLDRVLYNQKFRDLFPNCLVTHLIRQDFDHVPLYLLCNSKLEAVVNPFKFLNFSTKHPEFKKIIKDNWTVDFKGCSFTKMQAKMNWVK